MICCIVVVVVVVVSHIQRIGCQPEKTTLHGGQSRSWSAEQGKENKRKSLAAYPPPHPPHCSFGENYVGPKKIYIGHKILMKPSHDCTY